MIEAEFLQIASSLKGFGTENVGPLLYSLIRFCRPNSVFEVGVGYSTLFILKALKDNIVEDNLERDQDKYLYGKTEYYSNKYDPKLICMDDSSHPGSVVQYVSQAASFLDISDFLSLNNADFRGFSRNIHSSNLPLDFVWFDCGSLNEHEDFISEYWNLVNPDGGILLFHSTLTNLNLQVFLKTLKSRQATSDFSNFELLSLLEPHKKFQNSISMIRMISQFNNKIYTIHP